MNNKGNVEAKTEGRTERKERGGMNGRRGKRRVEKNRKREREERRAKSKRTRDISPCVITLHNSGCLRGVYDKRNFV